jgi:hypothetical protein
VVGTLSGKRRPEQTLAQAILVPNSQGALESSLKIPVAERFTQVCIAAITVTPPTSTKSFQQLADAGCPPRAGEATVWTTLRVPS